MVDVVKLVFIVGIQGTLFSTIAQLHRFAEPHLTPEGAGPRGQKLRIPSVIRSAVTVTLMEVGSMVI